MNKSRAEMKAELMKQAEAIIDELLEWQAETERPNFNQVEEKVLELRLRIARAVARAQEAE